MLRASRLVIDTGIHMKSWTTEESEEMLRTNTAMTEHEVQSEIQRYITTPGQACAYMMGFLNLQELRELAESVLGSSFKIKDFHDEVLQSGPTSLEMLERKIKLYMQKVAGQG